MKRALLVGLLAIALAGCRHTVEVKAPEEPITINVNVKIEHEIRVKVDRELDDLMEEESEIF
jgi:hypothetical protein